MINNLVKSILFMANSIFKLLLFCSLFIFIDCGKKKDPSDGFRFNKKSEKTIKSKQKIKASKRVDLENKGIGPVKSVSFDQHVDRALVDEGKVLYEEKCTICHKIGEKFIGPAPDGVLKRRSPEWVMNMILNPEVMLKEDKLAKDLFMEYNGTPMSNQGLSKDEARAILEYFRTL